MLLNPGALAWQNHLVGQITHLIDQYSFDGVFLDISAGWWNDPDHNVYDGTRRLCARIREGHPNVLIGGEGWYDAIGLATPLSQSGHTHGVLHWHDQPYADFFDRYNRCFAHLCLGDPSRGSAGVHELGDLAYNPSEQVPLRKGIIPTVTIVEDTMDRASNEIVKVIDAAKKYATLYLKTN